MGCAPSATIQLASDGTPPTKPSQPKWECEATKLHEAVDGIGTDEDSIVTLLASFKNRERQRIMQTYKKLYQKDLISVLKSELSLVYQQAVMALLLRPAVYDAISIHDAIDDIDYDSLTEVICSRNPVVLDDIRDAYEEEFYRTLDEDLANVKDKDLRELLLKFSSVNRVYVRSKADRGAAKERAAQLVSRQDLVELLCEPLGRNQLKATFEELEEMTTESMEGFIEKHYKDNSEEMRKALKAYVACTVSPPEYFAKELYKSSVHGQISKTTKVLRIIVTRSETDLYYIKKEYLSRFSVNLSKAIQKKCHNGYKAMKIILDIRGQFTESAVRM